jgi:hypothetical protein
MPMCLHLLLAEAHHFIYSARVGERLQGLTSPSARVILLSANLSHPEKGWGFSGNGFSRKNSAFRRKNRQNEISLGRSNYPRAVKGEGEVSGRDGKKPCKVAKTLSF